ncbi:hypothetical protein DRH14_02605 [Candidatus Shapirobacteria bacterium]|nr:MAG: hypothetical protein DRH14_02605 [Candidatus Shapirobacteria bacterium]
MFDALNTVIVYTNNINKSKSFYLNTLGFVLIRDDGHFIELKVNPDDKTSFAINLADSPEKVPGKQTVILKTNDVDNIYNILLEKKVNVLTEVKDFGWGKTFMFTDIDGNKIEVI